MELGSGFVRVRVGPRVRVAPRFRVGLRVGVGVRVRGRGRGRAAYGICARNMKPPSGAGQVSCAGKKDHGCEAVAPG